MSTLWTRAVHHDSMAWIQNPDEPPRTPVPTKRAGFAGYVGPGDDSDLIDSTMPEATRSERAFVIQHGVWPNRFQERHEQAWEHARKNRSEEDKADIDDPRLHHFLTHHWSDPYLWKKVGSFGSVDLQKPIYATQTHVAQEHLDKYHNDPQAPVQNAENRTEMDAVAPMFIKHEGRMHAIEGHHRVGAAIHRGDPSIDGWTFDLDNHYMRGYDDHDQDYR